MYSSNKNLDMMCRFAGLRLYTTIKTYENYIYIYIYILREREEFTGLVGCYGIPTIVDYLMPNPLYTYMLIYIYDLEAFLNEPELFFYTQLKINSLLKNSKRRLCGDRDETFNQIKSEYSKLAQKECKSRHDWVGKGIHRELCK